jgi:hypothetical protein
MKKPVASGSRDEALRALGLLVLMSAAFAVFAWSYVPRLNNYVIGDVEFTGWTGLFAGRLARGERPYIDFVLPIPPGSFLLLAGIQKLMGKELLLQELGLIAISHLGMAWIAYAIAQPLTTRLNAVLVAIGTLVLVLQMPKECAYDHTAQLCAWGSIAFGVRALLAEPGPRRQRFWFLTGLVAFTTFGFKQSTAMGIVFGWAAAFGYLAFVGRRAPAAAHPVGRDLRPWLGGAAGGLVLVVALVLAAGSTLGAFFQAVFVDGPALKGGSLTLARNLADHLFLHETYPSGLAVTALCIAIGLRAARFERRLTLGDEPVEERSLGLRNTIAVAALLIAGFGLATALLALELRMLPQSVMAVTLELRDVPMLGLAFGCAYFVGHLAMAPDSDPGVLRRGHVVNALFIVAAASSLLHALSFVHFFPFYNNDPLIPLALAFLFALVARARLGWLKGVAIVLTLGGLFGQKFNRALSADLAVESGHWAGLRVNYRGKELLDAVRRVHQLAGPNEAVLVLPEDAELVSLIGRPRPPLKGAIVFVDQYPARLAAYDIRALEQNLPKVIVIHPQKRALWERLYANWSKKSGAARVLEHVLDRVLPAHYRRDSSFRTVYFWDQGQLEIWVRSGGGRI